MVNGAGVGEGVSPDVIRNFRSLGSDRLKTIRGQGLSDQKVALIDQILAERQGARRLSERELVGGLAEPRTVESLRPSITPTPTEEALQQSLPLGIRGRTVQEVTRGQTLRETIVPEFGRTQSIPVTIPTPTLAPSREERFETSIIPQQTIAPPSDIRQQTILRDEVQPTTQPSRTQQAISFFFGETGREFVGIDITPKLFPSLQRADITATEFQTLFRQAPGRIGFPVRVAAELIPTTPGEVAITGGLIGTTILAAPIIGTGISLGVAGFGFAGALDEDLTIEERTASGLVGVLGGVGAAAGVAPFVRGRFLPSRPVRVAPEGFKTITGITEAGEIGLIQPGRGARTSIDLPRTSPLVRGGFGVREFEKIEFLGEEQFLATSQRGFFKPGVDVPIQREFFVTPQEPTLGIPETRVSRLGLQDPFKFPESVEIGFGLPPRPQIGIVRGEVARTERGGAFAIGTGTELEAIRTTGIITDVRQIGRTRIGGQGIDIFEFQVGRGVTTPRGRPTDFLTTEGTTRVSGETILGTLGRRPTRAISRPTSGLISPIISFPISPGVSPPISLPLTSLEISTTLIPPVSPPTPTISPPVSPPLISPPIVPPVSPPTVPLISPPFLPPFLPPDRPPRRRKPKMKERKGKKSKKRITPIRPSFTGIVLEIEEAAIVDPIFGVLPGQIRGLRTGFRPPRQRARKKPVKKKTVKKKRRTTSLTLTDL